jgi:hypothetical protein
MGKNWRDLWRIGSGCTERRVPSNIQVTPAILVAVMPPSNSSQCHCGRENLRSMIPISSSK